MDIFLAQAVKNLAPNSEFTIKENDYSTIEWHVLKGEAPTQAQVDAAIEQLKSDEAQAKAQAQVAKTALLDRLGLSADELATLLA